MIYSNVRIKEGLTVDFEFLDTSFLKNDEICLELEKIVLGDLSKNWVPAYHFFICSPSGIRMGKTDLRIGHNDNTFYGGNIGYSVDPKFRGRHYAAKAVRLLFELAKRHGMDYLYITCNPENTASYRTCELAGGKPLGVFELPEDNDMRIEEGETHKCIFRFEL